MKVLEELVFFRSSATVTACCGHLCKAKTLTRWLNSPLVRMMLHWRAQSWQQKLYLVLPCWAFSTFALRFAQQYCDAQSWCRCSVATGRFSTCVGLWRLRPTPAFMMNTSIGRHQTATVNCRKAGHHHCCAINLSLWPCHSFDVMALYLHFHASVRPAKGHCPPPWGVPSLDFQGVCLWLMIDATLCTEWNVLRSLVILIRYEHFATDEVKKHIWADSERMGLYVQTVSLTIFTVGAAAFPYSVIRLSFSWKLRN